MAGVTGVCRQTPCVSNSILKCSEVQALISPILLGRKVRLADVTALPRAASCPTGHGEEKTLRLWRPLGATVRKDRELATTGERAPAEHPGGREAPRGTCRVRQFAEPEQAQTCDPRFIVKAMSRGQPEEGAGGVRSPLLESLHVTRALAATCPEGSSRGHHWRNCWPVTELSPPVPEAGRPGLVPILLPLQTLRTATAEPSRAARPARPQAASSVTSRAIAKLCPPPLVT